MQIYNAELDIDLLEFRDRFGEGTRHEARGTRRGEFVSSVFGGYVQL